MFQIKYKCICRKLPQSLEINFLKTIPKKSKITFLSEEYINMFGGVGGRAIPICSAACFLNFSFAFKFLNKNNIMTRYNFVSTELGKINEFKGKINIFLGKSNK